MLPRNRLFRRRKTSRSKSSLSIFSRIAGFFSSLFSCFPKNNIVAPIEEDDNQMIDDSSVSSNKAVNGSITEAFSFVNSSAVRNEEWNNRSRRINVASIHSNEFSEEIDDGDSFEDAETSLDSSSVESESLSFHSMLLPILSSERIKNKNALLDDDDQSQIATGTPIQCSSPKNSECKCFSLENIEYPSFPNSECSSCDISNSSSIESLEEKNEKGKSGPNEKLVNPCSSSKDFVEEHVKQEINQEPVFSDGDLSIDELVNDILQLPTSTSDAFPDKNGCPSEVGLPELESGSSSGISCTFDSTTSAKLTNDVSAPDVSVPDMSVSDVLDPGVSIIDASVPETLDTDTHGPDAPAHDAYVLHVSVSDVSVPDASIAEAPVPDVPAIDVSVPGGSVSGVSENRGSIPDAFVTDTFVPDMSVPDVPAIDVSLPGGSVPGEPVPDAPAAVYAPGQPISDVSGPDAYVSQMHVPDASISDIRRATCTYPAQLDNNVNLKKDAATKTKQYEMGSKTSSVESFDIEKKVEKENVATEINMAPDLVAHYGESRYDVSLPEYENNEADLVRYEDLNVHKDALTNLGTEQQERCSSADSWLSDSLSNEANHYYEDDSFESDIEDDNVSAISEESNNLDDLSSLDNDQMALQANKEEVTDETDKDNPEEFEEMTPSAKDSFQQKPCQVKSILKVKSTISNPKSENGIKKRVRFANNYDEQGYVHHRRKTNNESKSTQHGFHQAASYTNFALNTCNRKAEEIGSTSAEGKCVSYTADKVVDYPQSMANVRKGCGSIGLRKKKNSFAMFIPSGEMTPLQRRNQHLFFQARNQRPVLQFREDNETEDYDSNQNEDGEETYGQPNNFAMTQEYSEIKDRERRKC